MLSQRLYQTSLRRLAAQQPSILAASKFTSPSAILLQTRFTSSTPQRRAPMTAQDSLEILKKQRLSRPVAPHLTIYQPQVTWVLSGLNRVTGVTLSGALYVFGLAYLAAPVLGWNMTSTAMAVGFAKWPLILKGMAKMGLALPFTFHSFNALRHLAWDTGSQLTNRKVQVSGWTVVAVSIASALGIAVFL